jgi:hypothetical protein
MVDAFSILTLVVASAVLAAIGFAESSALMGWPLWASAAVGVLALAAGIVAFKPVMVEPQPPRSNRRRSKKTAPKAGPISEIPLPPVKPKLKRKLDDIARELDAERAPRKRRGNSKKPSGGHG